MGMNDLFTPNKANLSGISKQGQLYVDEIYHKAFIKVDEDGTEAAAASGAVINMESLGKYFNANHPFLFKIVENKFGNVVFEGYLVNPSIWVDAKRNDRMFDDFISFIGFIYLLI